MMFQILEFKKSKTDKRKGYAKHTFSFIELFIKITIATSIIFSLGVSNICAQDNEEFELEYNLDDDRMDVSNGIESEIPLGTCKQWIAALLVLENSRDMTKQLPILFQDEQEKWVPIIFYRGQEITVQDAIYSLWMFPTESIYKSIAIYLAQSEIEFDSLLQKKIQELGMTRTSISKNTTTLQDLQILLAYCWNSEEMKGFLQEPYIESSLNAMLMNPYREKENDEEIEFIFESNSLRFLIYEVSDSSILSIHSIKSDITTHIQKAKNEYHVQSLLEENQTIATVKAQGTILPVNIDVISKREVALLPYKVDTKAIHFEFVENDLNYPIQKGEILGTLSIYENDTLLKKVPYKAEQSYFDIKHYVSISCIVLMIGIVEFRRRRKKL